MRTKIRATRVIGRFTSDQNRAERKEANHAVHKMGRQKRKGRKVFPCQSELRSQRRPPFFP